jgi:cbb3-type cytochrome c oxidase subunit III
VRERVVAGTVLAAGVVLAATACGTGGLGAGGDTSNGQKLFVSKCGGCHVLAAAGTNGTTGPSLDAAFAEDVKEGYPKSSIRAVVLDQIRFAILPMPANLVKGQDAHDVATYVASVAGINGAEAAPPAVTGTNGAAIFKANCSSCHTLAAAKSTGTIGPNLDQLKPALPIVVRQVTNGGAVMPAFRGRLTPAQIQAVAKYVASNAGKK